MATSAAVSQTSPNAYVQSLQQTSSTTSASTISDTENRFLTLLTAQLKNQDPLNPMDNAQVTSQMAQINMVGGIDKLNATLNKMLAGSNDSQWLQASSMVGRSVLVAGSNLTLGAQGALGGFELAGAADKVKVVITDGNGLEVRSIVVDGANAGVNDFLWDGKNDSGAAAAQGAYKFTVAAVRGGEKVKATALELQPVNGIVRETNGMSVDVGNLGRIALTDVKSIY